MRLRPGDRVAVVSPSFAAPALFPRMHEQAMRRLREDFGLVPVEYPTTRRHHAPAADRAADLMAAWSDTGVRAVFATIGGDDQLTVLPHLDPAPFVADPKPFFGYSDNTNLLNWLSLHGVPAFHGGATQQHLARGGGIDEAHERSLRAALFDGGDFVVEPLPGVRDGEVDWSDERALTETLPTRTAPGWVWHNADRVVSGPTWGGNLEILHWNLAANRWIAPNEAYTGRILLLETSEEMPPAAEVYRMLRNAGERGLLERFPAVLHALPMAALWGEPEPEEDRQRYRDEQREAVLRALAEYNPGALVVSGVEFGHTSPQYVLPYGGRMTVDGPARKVVAHF